MPKFRVFILKSHCAKLIWG